MICCDIFLCYCNSYEICDMILGAISSSSEIIFFAFGQVFFEFFPSLLWRLISNEHYVDGQQVCYGNYAISERALNNHLTIIFTYRYGTTLKKYCKKWWIIRKWLLKGGTTIVFFNYAKRAITAQIIAIPVS